MNPSRKRVLTKLGKALAELRRDAGLSQEELAHKSGLHRTYIGGLERAERNPTITTLVALSKGLGVGVAELIRRAGL